MTTPSGIALRPLIEREYAPETLPKLAAITCDIEQDFGGRTGKAQLLQDPAYMRELLQWCDSAQAPLTGFLVTSLLSSPLPGVKEVMERGTELHPHSHSHDTNVYRERSAEEIAQAQRVWTAHFGAAATGYRAPQGVILPRDIEALRQNGYAFDASIFPARRRNVFDYRDLPTNPWTWKGGILELPFSSTDDHKRLTLSTLKLWGKTYWERKLDALPRVVVIDTHLHDFSMPSGAQASLPLLMRVAYGRNQTHGYALLSWLTEALKARGYRFMTMQAIAKTVGENAI